MLGLHPIYWFAGCCAYAMRKKKKQQRQPEPSDNTPPSSSGTPPSDTPRHPGEPPRRIAASNFAVGSTTQVNPHRYRFGSGSRRFRGLPKRGRR